MCGIYSKLCVEYIPNYVWNIFQIMCGIYSKLCVQYIPNYVWNIFQIHIDLDSTNILFEIHLNSHTCHHEKSVAS
jgi:hypothetical protein